MTRTNVHPIETLREVHRLMRKLNLTPADALRLLAETLSALVSQIDDYETELRDAFDLPFPKWLYGYAPDPGAYENPAHPTGP